MYSRTAVLIAALAAVSIAAGFAVAATAGWLLFCAGVAVILAFHLGQLKRLLRWLRDPDAQPVPGGRGVWDDAFALIYRRERTAERRERELTSALARFREAAQAFPDGVIVLDARDHILWCNQNAEQQFGLSLSTDAGQPVRNLVRQPEFIDYLKARDYSRPLTLRASRGGGAVLVVSLIPFGEAEKLMHSRDITQEERLETVRRDFVANVSHELRTPLTVLVGFLETVRELKLGPEQRSEYFDLMTEQSRRMQRIVDDLLTLSSLEFAAPPRDDERISVSALLQKVKVDAVALSEGKHRISLDAAGDYDLLGSEAEIASAFSNLVSNAVRYTPPGGEVRLVWRGSPQGASLAVEDTGIGIERVHIPRLTERFYRVDRGRSRATGGTGLGLAIVKHALARHQATLEIESEPGKGSRFTVRFPAGRVVAAPPQTDSAQRIS